MSSSEIKINPAAIANRMAIAAAEAAPETIEDKFKANNDSWVKLIPRLSKLVKVVKDNKLEVIFDEKPEFPGLIHVMIYEAITYKLHKELMIDPCVIYGDCYRLITMDNELGDIRKETYVPLHIENLITKAVTEGLGRDDRKKINEKLPRAITDYRDLYCLIDKVDLRDTEMDYASWRQLIINISNVLKDKSVPLCRLRVDKVESPTKFKLVCDTDVLSAYNTPIFMEPTHIEAATRKFWVDYDAEKYPDKFVVGYFS